MNPCRRFEQEGLLLLERGLPFANHFHTCPDCVQALEAYERLQRELASAGARYRPPAGWQSRVRAAVAAREARRAGWRLRLMIPAGVAAALVLLFLLVPDREPMPVALQAEVELGSGAMRRGREPHPGDVLRLRGATGGAPHAEIRVYLNDAELVLRCSTAAPCRRRAESLEASVVLDSIGSYQPVLLVSDRPLPGPVATLDDDAAAAIAAGAHIAMSRQVEVR